MKDAPFDDPFIQSEIREQIALVCGGDQCLSFVAVDSAGTTLDNPSCPITELPTGDDTVDRGSVLEFTVTCEEGTGADEP